MKRVRKSWMLFVNLVLLSTNLTAQDDAARHHPHYKLIDIGTLGGPISYGPVNGLGSKLLNNEGVVSSYADTTAPDPLAACYVLDCLVAHA